MILNLTPHAIKVFNEDGSPRMTLEPFGVAARVAYDARRVGAVDGVPLMEATFGEVQNLPSPQEGMWFVVSSFVASAISGERPDCIVPDRQIRNAQGQVVGCRAFRRA